MLEAGKERYWNMVREDSISSRSSSIRWARDRREAGVNGVSRL
ncbi:hypothetical protein [Paenibacillus sinopodophylli]|nr:hypothetical protein [Paenibacillus sinopodophylli]